MNKKDKVYIAGILSDNLNFGSQRDQALREFFQIADEFHVIFKCNKYIYRHYFEELYNKVPDEYKPIVVGKYYDFLYYEAKTRAYEDIIMDILMRFGLNRGDIEFEEVTK